MSYQKWVDISSVEGGRHVESISDWVLKLKPEWHVQAMAIDENTLTNQQ